MGFRATKTTQTLGVVTVVAVVAIPASAQSQSIDEREIRDLIARYDAQGESSVPGTADMIYWTGPFKRPTVGAQQRDPLPADLQPSAPPSTERVPGSRRRITTPIRIEIARSGELAYEYSNSEVRFDLKDRQQEVARPHYIETTAPSTK
jgi:hypothetical protein